MAQMTLLEVPKPHIPDTIDLRNCSAQDLIEDLRNSGTVAQLVGADPPWHYAQAPGHSAHAEENHYPCLKDHDIAQILCDSYDIVGNGRLALWCTWPKLGGWTDTAFEVGFPWRYVSGGSWAKAGPAGTGFHWLGVSECVLVYVKGTGLCTKWTTLPNHHHSYKECHSMKPADWMAGWLERWTKPGDIVVDLFAGMGPLALACIWTGRKYIGCEIDPARHRQAIDRIAINANNKPKYHHA